jgi:hypothetical protein
MASLIVPAGGSIDVVIPAAAAIAVESFGSFQVVQMSVGSPNQPMQPVIIADVVGSAAPSSFTSSVFTNGATVRVIATGNLEVYYEVGTSPIVKQFRRVKQVTPTAFNATATATVAQLLASSIITSTTGAAVALTLPTATLTDAASSWAVGESLLFDIIVTGANALTVTTATGWTLVGNMVVATVTSAQFKLHKTAANTFTCYRIG